MTLWKGVGWRWLWKRMILNTQFVCGGGGGVVVTEKSTFIPLPYKRLAKSERVLIEHFGCSTKTSNFNFTVRPSFWIPVVWQKNKKLNCLRLSAMYTILTDILAGYEYCRQLSSFSSFNIFVFVFVFIYLFVPSWWLWMPVRGASSQKNVTWWWIGRWSKVRWLQERVDCVEQQCVKCPLVCRSDIYVLVEREGRRGMCAEQQHWVERKCGYQVRQDSWTAGMTYTWHFGCCEVRNWKGGMLGEWVPDLRCASVWIDNNVSTRKLGGEH